MEVKKLFYETDQYLSVEESNKEAELLVRKNIDNLLKNSEAMKRFKEEIYPIIKLAEHLNIPYIRFCGNENKSIDAELKENNGKITKVECTTSIDGYYQSLLLEYISEYKSCFIGPHSKTFNINDREKACSNDIVYSGTQHNRKFVNQKELINDKTIESCIVDIKEYAHEDIKKIKSKVDKGNCKNQYKNFVLILVCAHNIDRQEVAEYQKLIHNFWNSILSNPFSALFIVNYDDLLFKQLNYNPELNPNYVPVPLLFINR